MPTPSTAYGTPPQNFNGVAAPLNFRHKRADIVLQNGDNNNIARSDANYLRITGPAAAFSISGFDTPLNGMVLYVHVAIAQQLTLKNKTLSPTKNQIDTLTGADVVITATPCVITFLYDSQAQKWVYGGLQAAVAPSTGIAGEVARIAMLGKYSFTSAATALGSWQHAMLGDYLFCVDQTNGRVTVFNASDIHHLTWISNFTLTGAKFLQIAGAGKYLYVWTFSTPNYTLNVIDASNPYALASAGTFGAGTRAPTGSSHMTVWSRANTVYLTYASQTTGTASFRITTLNVTNPAAITLVGDYQPGSDSPAVVDVTGQYVCAATYQSHLYILDYSTPATPSIVSTTTLPSNAYNGDMAAGMDYLYVSLEDVSGGETIYPINIANPASPSIGTGFAPDALNPHGSTVSAYRLMLSGAYLVCFLYDVVPQDYGFSVFGLTSPSTPAFLSRLSDDFFYTNTNAAISSMFVKDRFIYAFGNDEAGNGAAFVFGF